jgi:acyl-CoA thioester hydrolase
VPLLSAEPGLAGKVKVMLETGGRTVPQEWIDYNGHMMDAYYFVAFTEATESFLDHVDLGEAYRERSGCGIYTVESHLCFAASVREGEQLRYHSQLLGADAKRLHLFHTITTVEGTQVATNELMFLHVALDGERVTAMPGEQQAIVEALAKEHHMLVLPPQAGRRIAMPVRT